MSEATRRKIRQLRALADSTTFPEEAKSARAKADQLERELPAAAPAFDQAAFGAALRADRFDAMYAFQFNTADLYNEMLRDIMDEIKLRGL